jgi:thiol-disulfide isomerase/thioredoxin
MGETDTSRSRVARRRILRWAGGALALAPLGLCGEAGATQGPPRTGALAKFILHGEPKPAPTVGFKAADGSPRALADFSGRILLVNYWATWCTPCVAEMPSLDRLQGELGGEDFTVLPVSSDRGGITLVQPFYERTGLKHLKIYLDPDSTFTRASGVRGLPTSILFDRRGREIGRILGNIEWDTPEAKAFLRYFVDQVLLPGSPKVGG